MSFPASWLTPDLMTRPSRSLSELRAENGWVLWHERRPEEKGRGVVRGRAPSGVCFDLTPPDADVGSAVHYGGGAWTFRVSRETPLERKGETDGEETSLEVYFTDRKKGGLWHSRAGAPATRLTASDDEARYADLVLSGERLICLREREKTPAETVRETGVETVMEIVACPIVSQKSVSSKTDSASSQPQETQNETVLVRGSDFMLAPRPSPDGKFLAWVEWNYPHMPWTATRFCVAPLGGLLAGNAAKTVLIGEREETEISTIEPFWGPDGTLYALSDRPFSPALDRSAEAQIASRAWTPVAFKVRAEKISAGKENSGVWHDCFLPPAPAEIGLPPWVFGQSSCVALPNGVLLARGLTAGLAQVLSYAPDKGWQEVSFPGTPESAPQLLEGEGKEGPEGQYAWIDTPMDQPPCVKIGPLERTSEKEPRKILGKIPGGTPVKIPEIIRESWTLPPPLVQGDISKPRLLRCPVSSVSSAPGPLSGPLYVYALYTPPASGPHCAPVLETQRPPMVVIVHGGPTGQARPDLSFKVQWWATRGFAVLEVNYRGSTGFGRAYREALDGNWGVLDVEDCLTATRAAIAQGLADPDRCVIRGTSAGGLTVLAALARGTLFRAGTSLYGVTDLRALAQDTHRFEARYLDGLVAPWPAREDVYLDRSPLSWPERIEAPVLFLHGGKDGVVPLSQAQALHEKLPRSALHVYPEEGHGFRAPETISDSLQRELAFYLSVFEKSSNT